MSEYEYVSDGYPKSQKLNIILIIHTYMYMRSIKKMKLGNSVIYSIM